MSRLLVTSIRAVLMGGGGNLTEVGSRKTGKRGNGR